LLASTSAFACLFPRHRDGRFGAEEGLAAGPFWRDHEASMTQPDAAGSRET
jgi:hypothetical protein